MDFNTISIGVVESRDNDFVKMCLNSINRQWYIPECTELIEVNNLKREHTIGACYNEIVKKATKDWVLFIGDDDMIARTYLFNLNAFLEAFRERHDEDPVCVTTNIILYSETEMVSLDAVPQGMWNREYLLENPFNEELPRYVDTDMFDRTEKLGKLIIHDQTNSGYYYRQHDDNISGNKFERKGGISKIMKDRIEANKRFGVIV